MKLKSERPVKLNWRVYAIVVVTLLLLYLLIFPGRVLLDRNVLMLVGIIVILVLWPTLKSGKIPYILEMQKNIKKSK